MFAGLELASWAADVEAAKSVTEKQTSTATEADRRPLAPLGPDSAVIEQIVTSDGTQQFVHVWAASPQSPVIIYLHGIEGHGRWFSGTALELNKAGYSVYAADRRGAGLSMEPRGDARSYKRLVEDVQELLSYVCRRHPGKPIFLIGNCWGGKLATVLAAGPSGGQLSGLILTSPAIVTDVDMKPVDKLKVGLSLLTGKSSRLFDIPLTPEHFTDNPPYLRYITADPLRLRQATARFFVENLKLSRAARNASRKLRIPVLVMQSGRDRIVRLAAIQVWFGGIGSLDKTLKIFTTAAHSLDFEPDQAEYHSMLANWLNARAARNGGPASI